MSRARVENWTDLEGRRHDSTVLRGSLLLQSRKVSRGNLYCKRHPPGPIPPLQLVVEITVRPPRRRRIRMRPKARGKLTTGKRSGSSFAAERERERERDRLRLLNFRSEMYYTGRMRAASARSL